MTSLVASQKDNEFASYRLQTNLNESTSHNRTKLAKSIYFSSSLGLSS
jgi:hypothetical protein